MELVGPKRLTAEPITSTIAQRVRTLRERSGLSQDELAQRMATLGKPWNRGTVINLERRAVTASDNKKRRSTAAGRDAITIGEWFALAQALRVPPLALLVDPTSNEPISVTDNTSITAWELLAWVIGDNLDERLSPEGVVAAEQLRMTREVSRELVNYRISRAALVIGDDEQREELDRRLLGSIGFALQRLVVLRLPQPQLPPDIAQRARELGIDLLPRPGAAPQLVSNDSPHEGLPVQVDEEKGNNGQPND